MVVMGIVLVSKPDNRLLKVFSVQIERVHYSPCLSQGLAAKPIWCINMTQAAVITMVPVSLSEKVRES